MAVGTNRERRTLSTTTIKPRMQERMPISLKRLELIQVDQRLGPGTATLVNEAPLKSSHVTFKLELVIEY